MELSKEELPGLLLKLALKKDQIPLLQASLEPHKDYEAALAAGGEVLNRTRGAWVHQGDPMEDTDDVSYRCPLTEDDMHKAVAAIAAAKITGKCKGVLKRIEQEGDKYYVVLSRGSYLALAQHFRGMGGYIEGENISAGNVERYLKENGTRER